MSVSLVQARFSPDRPESVATIGPSVLPSAAGHGESVTAAHPASSLGKLDTSTSTRLDLASFHTLQLFATALGVPAERIAGVRVEVKNVLGARGVQGESVLDLVVELIDEEETSPETE